MVHDREYRVTIQNNTRYPGTRQYSVCAALPEISGPGVAVNSISRAICFAPRSGIPSGGRDDFTFEPTYFAFIGVLDHDRIRTNYFYDIHLGDDTNNGSVVLAHWHPPATLTLARAPDTQPGSKEGTFSIACVNDPPEGHNIVVGLAQRFNNDKVVVAGVKYHYGAVYQIRPLAGLAVRVYEGATGQVVPQFDDLAFRIHFHGLDRELSVFEEEGGTFWDDKSGKSPPWDPWAGGRPQQPFQPTLTTIKSFPLSTPQQNAFYQPVPGPQTAQGSQHSPTPPPQAPAPGHSSPPLPGNSTPPEDDGEEESVYDELRDFDTVFIIDDSGSMKGRLWAEVQHVLSEIASICVQYDEDGIDIYFLNAESRSKGDAAKGQAPGGYLGVKDTDTVMQIFKSVRPRGTTPTAERLDEVLKAYLKRYEESLEEEDVSKPLNVIIITDGRPSNHKKVVTTIRDAAMRLDDKDADPSQVGLQFFQVGTDIGAAKALQELDDDLGDDIRDMVDTVAGNGQPLTPDIILKTVTGGFNRRQDRTSV